MNIEEIRGLLDLVGIYPNVEEISIEANGTRIRLCQKQHECPKGRAAEMVTKKDSQDIQYERIDVKAPVVGMFYYLALKKSIQELTKEELEKIIANGNSRIEIHRGLYVAKGQVLGTIIQLNIPVAVEAPCAGIIEEVFLGTEERDSQQCYAVGYGDVLFRMRKA